MTRRRRATRDLAAYPALTAFARAYLHQDFIREYGGAIEAARAFGAEASPAERRALAVELADLVHASSDWSREKFTGFVTGTIGAAWATATPAALREMAAALQSS